MAYLIYFGIFLGTVTAGLGATFAFWAAYRFSTTRSDGHFVALLLWLIGISAMAVEMFSTRVPSLIVGAMEGLGGLESSPTSLSLLIGKISVPFIVGLAAVRFITGVISSNRSVYRGGDVASPLFYSYLVYFAFCGLLNSIAGTQPAFVHWMFYPVLIIGAAYYSRSLETDFLVKHAKLILITLIYCSLIAALLFPKFAFETGYKGLIPGLSIRLFGLTGHPNTLGPVALLFLVLEYFRPSHGLLRHVHRAAAICVFVMAQSKTAYVTFFIVMCILWLYRVSTIVTQKKRVNFRLGFLAAAFIGVATIGIGFLVLSMFNVKIYGNPFSYLDAQELKYLTTLTGRTMIWDITLKEWEQNPLFGYGPTIWYPDYRAKYGLFVVGQAHNQFIQSLGEAGAFGLIGFLIYLFFLLKFAFATAAYSRGVSLALLAIPLLRTWTETPFRNFVINDWAFFTHLIVFCLLIGFLRNKSTSAIRSSDSHFRFVNERKSLSVRSNR